MDWMHAKRLYDSRFHKGRYILLPAMLKQHSDSNRHGGFGFGKKKGTRMITTLE